MRLILSILILVTFSSLLSAQEQRGLREVNQIAAPPETSVIAIVGATLIDGRGGPAVPDSVVLVRGAQDEARAAVLRPGAQRGPERRGDRHAALRVEACLVGAHELDQAVSANLGCYGIAWDSLGGPGK